ncbi:MAG: tetratricopeptide repeat protein [Acidobacteriota bacterium]|nr:tetratricopeptide repeat protein [Acidobacteriota bacterium]
MVPALLLLLLANTSFDEAFRSGVIALQKGDLTAALSNLEAARKLSPRNGRVWVALSQTYWKLHQEAEAERAADTAAGLAAGDAVVQKSLAIYYSEAGHTLKAARAQTAYAEEVPSEARARDRAIELYFEAARPLIEKQKFAEAAAILEEGAKKLPKSEQLELALGVADYGLRRFDDAADAFLRTIDADPEIEQPYAFLGKMLGQIPARLPQVTERFAAYETAHPTNPEAFLRHAMALDAQAIEPETALRLIDKSLALNADNAAVHFEKGAVLDRLMRFADAVPEFERAAAMTPSDPAPHYRLARDYDRIRKPELAAAEREKHAQLVKAQDAVR